jgi:hypothetical protein
MRTIVPNKPPGQYPHDLLCGQVGNAPINSKIKTMRRIVPVVIAVIFLVFKLLPLPFLVVPSSGRERELGNYGSNVLSELCTTLFC